MMDAVPLVAAELTVKLGVESQKLKSVSSLLSVKARVRPGDGGIAFCA